MSIKTEIKLRFKCKSYHSYKDKVLGKMEDQSEIEEHGEDTFKGRADEGAMARDRNKWRRKCMKISQGDSGEIQSKHFNIQQWPNETLSDCLANGLPITFLLITNDNSHSCDGHFAVSLADQPT